MSVVKKKFFYIIVLVLSQSFNAFASEKFSILREAAQLEIELAHDYAIFHLEQLQHESIGGDLNDLSSFFGELDQLNQTNIGDVDFGMLKSNILEKYKFKHHASKFLACLVKLDFEQYEISKRKESTDGFEAAEVEAIEQIQDKLKTLGYLGPLSEFRTLLHSFCKEYEVLLEVFKPAPSLRAQNIKNKIKRDEL